MNQSIILFLLSIPFIYINYKIIKSDLKEKKIPNKYLGQLLLLIPFYYIYLFFSHPEINYLLFLGQIFLTFIVSFILYYFGIWAAGDAKYLLVLSLFIPYIGIIPFIGNIALITLIYLFGYFIWFYFYKITFNKKYRKSFWGNIKNDLNEKWKVYKNNKGGNTYKIILKWLIIFLVVFVSIRLSRLYLLHGIITSGQNSKFEIIREIIEKYNIYLVFLFIGIFIGGLILFKIGIAKLKNFIVKKFKLNLNLVGNILLGFLTIFLISFIAYEYLQNPYEIKNYLFKIFTIYLIVYIIFKILLYAYKITFGIAEYQYINIDDLKEGDIVDKEYLVRMLLKYLNTKYIENKGIKIPYKLKEEMNSEEFKKIIQNNDIRGIKKYNTIIKNILKLYKTNEKDILEIEKIRVLKTFPFGIFIFLGFFITFLLSSNLINKIIFYFIHLLSK